MPPRARDLSGTVLGKLTVLRPGRRGANGIRYWSVRCSCGWVGEMRYDVLTGDATRAPVDRCSACAHVGSVHRGAPMPRCEACGRRFYGRRAAMLMRGKAESGEGGKSDG